MLTIQNLTHTYPNGIQALKNISLDIPKGMFGLLGANGAGKSSLMRTIATLQQPTSGSIHLENIDILSEPDLLRRKLGYLPQDFGVYPRGSAYSLLDHLAVLKGITNSKKRKETVDNLLVQTNLYKMRKKRLATFSGGMRQRFGIAQALIGDPKLIIVDEPTAGLDPEERNRFNNLLSDIGEDVTVILSTHIVSDVSDLCPNMAVMANGELISNGAPAELIKKIENRIWKKAIKKPELATYKTKYNVISNHLSVGQVMIRVNTPSDPGNDFQPATANLEDVYFSALNAHRKNHSTPTTAIRGES